MMIIYATRISRYHLRPYNLYSLVFVVAFSLFVLHTDCQRFQFKINIENTMWDYKRVKHCTAFYCKLSASVEELKPSFQFFS